MRVIVCDTYNELSKRGTKLIESQILLKPDCILGLATGSTPVGIYKNLIKLNENGYLDFSKVKTFNLDEYYPISHNSDQSYHYFMDKNFFDHINIDKSNTHVPSGETTTPDEECKKYEQLIEKSGGVDLQILGIGRNGHIGFNEPCDNLITLTHITDLTQNTIEANSRFFENIDEVPTKAITMGIYTILKAKRIVILASGLEKHNIVKELLTDTINTSIPATLLKVHKDVTLICDKEAYNGI